MLAVRGGEGAGDAHQGPDCFGAFGGPVSRGERAGGGVSEVGKGAGDAHQGPDCFGAFGGPVSRGGGRGRWAEVGGGAGDAHQGPGCF